MLRLWLAIIIVCILSLTLAMAGALLVGQGRDTALFAYVAVCESRVDIFLADFNHRVSVPLTHDARNKGDIHWSPNGDFLAYTTSLGIRMITPTGDIEEVTQVADYNILWVDDRHLLFRRRDEQEGVWYDPFIIDIETHEIQPAENLRSDNSQTSANWSTNSEAGIFQWQVDDGGTDDFYITAADDMSNIQGRFTMDGSACYEIEPEFRP
jgi:hypothetical protein